MQVNAPWTLDIPSFLLGFLISGYLGWILQRIRRNRGTMDAPNYPMAVYTRNTPSHVFAAARAAFWRFLGWWAIMVFSFGAIVWIMYMLL